MSKNIQDETYLLDNNDLRILKNLSEKSEKERQPNGTTVKYFSWCPEAGFEEHETQSKAIDFSKKLIEQHLDFHWSENVGQVVIGQITHVTRKVNEVFRPDDSELDDEMIDGSGTCWSDPDISHMCNYELQPLSIPSNQDDLSNLREAGSALIISLKLADLREALKNSMRELQACQAVIHYAGGFDPAYVNGAKKSLKESKDTLDKCS